MKMTKTFIIVSVLTMGLAGCSMISTAADEHTHTAGSYEADLENHWQVCEEDGEKMESEAHTLDESDYCEICNKSVYDFGDGTYGVYSYDEQGALCLDEYYNEDGSLISYYRYEYDYDENAVVTASRFYIYDPGYYGEDEVLFEEAVYLPCENDEYGECYQAESTTYYEDGGKSCTEYAENSDIIRVVEYDAEGNEVRTERYEYEQDEQGERSYMAVYTDDVLSYEEFYVPGPSGFNDMTKQVYYEEDGSVMSTSEYEYEYDDEGNLLHYTIYDNGVPKWESIYELDDEGWAYLAKEIEYDENGELIGETKYDAEGNEVE